MTGFQRAAGEQGRAYEDLIAAYLGCMDYEVLYTRWRHPITDDEVDIVAARIEDPLALWLETKGSWRGRDNGLARGDSVKKLLGVATHLFDAPDRDSARYIVVTSDPPRPGSYPARLLGDAMAKGWIDAVWHIPLRPALWTPNTTVPTPTPEIWTP
jgi:Holliday junction resolvase-like predicted endonuclease